MIEHIAVGKVRLGDEVIHEVVHVYPLAQLLVFCAAGYVSRKGVIAHALEVSPVARKGGLVSADDVGGGRIDAIVCGEIILVLVFVKVVQAPVLTVDVYHYGAGLYVVDI